MALKVELKPGERIIIGAVVLRNGDSRARFFIDGQAAILREKDILTPETADTPAKRVYFIVQMMYLHGDIGKYHDEYFTFIKDFIEAAPSALPYISEINNQILSGELYKALKASRKLVDYELEIVSHASRGSGLCAHLPGLAGAARSGGDAADEGGGAPAGYSG